MSDRQMKKAFDHMLVIIMTTVFTNVILVSLIVGSDHWTLIVNPWVAIVCLFVTGRFAFQRLGKE